MSLNAVAHKLVLANRRKKIHLLIAAVGSLFLRSQQHCGVLQNVIRKQRFILIKRFAAHLIHEIKRWSYVATI